jgi:folate-binding protein YgfZ
MPIAHIDNRALLRFSGPDAKSFLQGLVSNDVLRATPDQAVYAGLLTPQGKFLHDLFILEHDAGLLLECEAQRLDDLRQRLLRHKLRAKISLDVEPKLKVYAGWDDTPHPLAPAVIDPRLPELGWRAYADGIACDATFSDYDQHRLSYGVADGSRDLELDKSTLQEGNFDLINGISFSKGCYLGQELTARIHYRGLVKRRLYPLQFDGPAPPYGTSLMSGEAIIGESRSSYADKALGLLSVSALASDFHAISGNGVKGKIIAPKWFKTIS